jgi:hypothetical protein
MYCAFQLSKIPEFNLKELINLDFPDGNRNYPGDRQYTYLITISRYDD